MVQKCGDFLVMVTAVISLELDSWGIGDKGGGHVVVIVLVARNAGAPHAANTERGGGSSLFAEEPIGKCYLFHERRSLDVLSSLWGGGVLAMAVVKLLA